MEQFVDGEGKNGILGWYEQERQKLKECAREYDIEITQKTSLERI